MKITIRGPWLAAATAAIVFAGLGLTACAPESSGPGATSGPSQSSGVSTATGFKVGLLLPDETSTRYETQDRPDFKAALTQLCPQCELVYANANQDAAKQQQQAESMLTQGVKVLVVDPWDGVAAASIVDEASSQGVPVVAYDRLIKSPKLSFIISNNYEKVGELQGQALVEKLKKDGVPAGSGIVMINGASTDNNAVNIRKGALGVIEPAGYKVLSHLETWDGPTAQKFAASQIAKFGNKITAFYTANDGNAQAAISAMNAAGMKLVPTTGLDATLASVQSILAGQQYMSVYNSFNGEATKAAQVAVQLATGQTPQSTDTIDSIPAFLQQPLPVTVDTIMSTVVKDGVYKISEICTPNFAAACTAHGIK
ncbi:sugar ABC transporter substrate-binding protein [Microbacterium kribbense]|uniref:Sugar ABC transporter substrate-binding protein n=1 Tax=Microbacterium kribbense TaxID=433645 RepID=A0ABP7GTQ6_9MICO